MANIQSIQQLGRYRDLVPVGAGSFATVYKAIDSLLGRTVALKVLAPNVAIDEEFVRDFLDEAQKAAAIDHHNVVRVYDVGEDSGQHYIALEYLEQSLDKLLAETGTLSVQVASKLLVDMASGLHAAHSQDPSLVHYDVKPHNILVDQNGIAKVGDFGIADFASATRGTGRGTPKYIAPEVATLSTKKTDRRSDVYSLGVVFFEMLTGRLPFDGATEYEVTKQHVESPAPDPREFVPDLPEWVAEIVLRCLKKNPDKRYSTMLEIVDAVATNDPLLEPMAAASRTIEFVPYRPSFRHRVTQLLQLAQTNRIASISIAVASVAILSLLLFVLSPDPSPVAQTFDDSAPLQVPVRILQSDESSALLVNEQLSNSPVIAQAIVDGNTQVTELRVLENLDEVELASMSFEVSVAENSIVAELPRMLNVFVDSFLQIDLSEVVDPHSTESTVNFSVENAWLDEYSLSADDIRLFRFADDSWWELNTIAVDETTSALEFEALTPGFSIFAIGSVVSDQKSTALGDAMNWPSVEADDGSITDPQRVVSVLQVPEATVGSGDSDDQSTATPVSNQSQLPTVMPTSTSSPTPVAAGPTPLPLPTSTPVPQPTIAPTVIALNPTASPTVIPTSAPTPLPTSAPTPVPTAAPTPLPTAAPTPLPTAAPTPLPTAAPTPIPTANPVPIATPLPSPTPTIAPTATTLPDVTPEANATPEPTSTPTATPVSTATPVPIEVNLSSDSGTYVHSELVQITFAASSGGIPTAGVQAFIVVNEPSNGSQQDNLITDASGSADYSFRMNKNKGGCGTYTVIATSIIYGTQVVSVISMDLVCN